MSVPKRTKVDLDDLVDTFRVINYSCLKNGNIIHLYLYNDRRIPPVLDTIMPHHEVDRKALYNRVLRMLSRYKILIKNPDQQWNAYCIFLNEPFFFPSSSLSSPRPSTPNNSTSILPPPSSFVDTTPLLSSAAPSTPHLRSDCHGCAHRRLTFSRLRATARSFQARIFKNSSTIRDIISKYNVKNINRFKTRKTTQVQRLKSQINELKLEISSLKSTINRLQRKADDSKKLKRSVRRCKGSVATNKAKSVGELLSAKENKTPNSSPDNTVMETVTGKNYTLSLRLCIYKALLCNVSTDNASNLLDFIYNRLTGNKLSSVPCAATVAHMSYELSALTYIQAANFVLSSFSPVTLSWDATTVSGSHINEVHVSRENPPGHIEHCTLQIEELGGGTARDYSAHITNVLLDVAHIYSKYKGLSKDAVYESLTAKIGSYMTDRCVVNDATARLLKDTFQGELLSLKCLVHPLDGCASSARSCLKKLDADHGITTKSFGKDCAVANVLHALTTLRFKAGAGDPQGMVKYFQDNKVPVGLIVRYVGNRLHVLFHMSAVVYSHLDLLLGFLNPINGRDSALKRALLADLKMPFIQTALQALGILGKIVTGPWMSAFYRDGKHMDAVPKLQTSFHNLEVFHSQPSLFLSTKNDIFGDALDMDSLRCLRNSPSELLQSLLKSVSGAILGVFRRQLDSYIPGGVYSSPSDTILQQSSGAPLHNMASERALGMADNAWRRAPNARIGFISGKTAASMNNLLGWLSTMSQKEQKTIVDTCISFGYRIHEEWKKRSLLTSEDILKRHQEARKKKDQSERRALERAMKEAVSEKCLRPLLAISSSLDFDVGKAEPFILDPSGLKGLLIHHTWEDDSSISVWNGRVRKLKQKKRGGSYHFIMEISYWAQCEEEINAEDYDIKLEALLTDMALGEMTIQH